MRLNLNERQHAIWNTVQREGEVKIGDLKELFSVTDMTIRRDLEKLEASGLIRRTFGGAIPVTPDVSLNERNAVLIDEKARIGRRAAELIEPDQAIFLDGGTTTLQVAKHIAPDHSITVVTNALNVAAVLLERGVHTIVTGGTILEKTGSMIGPIALHSLSSMAFDQVFLGTAGVTAEHGFSNSNSFEAELKRFVMGRSGKVNIVADSSKLGSRFLHSFAGLKDIHRFITDIAPPAAFAEIAQTEGVEVIASEM